MQPSGSVLETLLHLPDPHPPSHALDPYHWTIKLQNILSMPDITANDRMLKYTRLNSLNKDFIADVTVYAKTIISEYFIDFYCIIFFKCTTFKYNFDNQRT